MTIRYIDTGKVPWFRSQSLYHGLGHAMKKDTPDTVVLATPEDPYICIGNFQDVSLEIDRNYCKENNLPLIRRQTGGGAVYIDKNQLFVQWIFNPGSLPARVSERFDIFIEPLIQTHKFFGIDAYFHPVNDVHVDGKKIVGTGAAAIGDAEVVTGNFLFDFDHQKMAGALRLPHNSLRERVYQTLFEYVTTIKKQGGPFDMKEWKRVYLQQLEKTLERSVKTGVISDHEEKEIRVWDEKLKSVQWLEGGRLNKDRPRMIKIQANFWIGISSFETKVETGYIQIGINNNTLEFIEVEGKSGLKEINVIADTLSGVEIDSEKITKRLDSARQSMNGRRMMNNKDWTALIMKVCNEKKRLAGDE